MILTMLKAGFEDEEILVQLIAVKAAEAGLAEARGNLSEDGGIQQFSREMNASLMYLAVDTAKILAPPETRLLSRPPILVCQACFNDGETSDGTKPLRLASCRYVGQSPVTGPSDAASSVSPYAGPRWSLLSFGTSRRGTSGAGAKALKPVVLVSCRHAQGFGGV